ncbi:radical SAM protein [Sphingomonas sp. 22176]|uniref:radical SAM protein n=1 Tax=Sphingomonas sp. 22176 TaxID=3453884 RepID=UPI003F845DEC
MIDADVLEKPSSEGLTSDPALIQAMSLSNQTLQLIILPTEQCNFRCTYCYEDFSIGNMKPNIVTGIIKLMENRSKDLKELHLSYFGGEPLLNMRVISQISGAAKILMSGRGTFTSEMTTNGFLLDTETLRQLSYLECKCFQISLDGFKEGHDLTRRSRNGAPNFDTIWKNLIDARNSDIDFNISLRIHLRPGGEDSTINLVKAIRDNFADPRFSVFFKVIYNWGGSDPDHPKIFQRDDKLALNTTLSFLKQIEAERIQRIGGIPSSLAESMLVGREGADHSKPQGDFTFKDVCYASKANSFVIRANGRIAKCTVALRNPKNDVGAIHEDGTIKFDSEKLSLWLRGLVQMDRNVLTCPAATALK